VKLAGYSDDVTVTVHIPDDWMSRLSSGGGDLSRRFMEALAIDEYRQGRVSKAELRRILGFETRPALDGFLKEHGVFEEYTLDDLEHDRQDLQRAGF